MADDGDEAPASGAGGTLPTTLAARCLATLAPPEDGLHRGRNRGLAGSADVDARTVALGFPHGARVQPVDKVVLRSVDGCLNWEGLEREGLIGSWMPFPNRSRDGSGNANRPFTHAHDRNDPLGDHAVDRLRMVLRQQRELLDGQEFFGFGGFDAFADRHEVVIVLRFSLGLFTNLGGPIIDGGRPSGPPPPGATPPPCASCNCCASSTCRSA